MNGTSLLTVGSSRPQNTISMLGHIFVGVITGYSDNKKSPHHPRNAYSGKRGQITHHPLDWFRASLITRPTAAHRASKVQPCSGVSSVREALGEEQEGKKSRAPFFKEQVTQDHSAYLAWAVPVRELRSLPIVLCLLTFFTRSKICDNNQGLQELPARLPVCPSSVFAR